MATKPLWDLPPWEEIGHDPTKVERIETERRKREAAARAGAAVRARRAEQRQAARLLADEIETAKRAAERAEWLATHKAPTRTELETLRGMFLGLNQGRKAR
jgi:hypothetical protein